MQREGLFRDGVTGVGGRAASSFALPQDSSEHQRLYFVELHGYF
jgi:hypothetical protein